MSNVHLPHVPRRVEFLEIDLRPQGDQVYYFCNSNTYLTDDPLAEAVTWGGRNWVCRPFTSTGWKRGETVERPKVKLPDPNATLYNKLEALGGAGGASIQRYQALGDAIEAGTAFPISHERYLLNTYQATPGLYVEIELASIFDFRKSKSPSFIMTRKHYPGLGSNLTR